MAKIKFKDLEDFVNNTDFNKEPLQLDQCSLILNRETFAKSHLAVLKANSGNKIAMPYYNRLVKFYKKLKK